MNGPKNYEKKCPKKFPSLGMALVILAALASGCSSSAKKHHNSSLGLLSDDYGTQSSEKVALNPRHVRESGKRIAATRAPVRSSDLSPSRRPAATVVPASEARQIIPRVALRWPLRSVQITSPYGQRGREFHEGLDLRAKVGTPVYAAHAGQVLYSNERIRGYGRMVVIRHTSGLATIYAHNSRLLVRRGQWVAQGALIAYSGNTGHSHGPHLHFEVRAGVSTINPLILLPKPSFSLRAKNDTAGHYVAQE